MYPNMGLCFILGKPLIRGILPAYQRSEKLSIDVETFL